MSLLTVITTFYNCEKYLEQAINGCVNQSFKDFQWILINDGSTDKSQEILDGMIDQELINDINLLVINDGYNKGLPTRLNEALKRVDTEYCCLLDGDDISEPNRFITQIKALKTNPKVWACGSLPIIINEYGTIDGKKTDWYYNTIPSTTFGIRQQLINKQNPIIHPSMMFVTEAHPGYNEQESRCPDLDLWYRTIDKEIINVPYQLIKYRIHSNNLSGRFGHLMEEDRLRISKKYLGN